MSFKEKSVGRFLVADSGPVHITEKVTYSDTIDQTVAGSKIVVGVETLEPCELGNVKVGVQLSFDGENFSNPVDVKGKIDATKKGMDIVTVDLTEYTAPFYRLIATAEKDAPKKSSKSKSKKEDGKEDKDETPETFGCLAFHYASKSS